MKKLFNLNKPQAINKLMSNKFILIILLLLCLTTTVNAEVQTLGTFKQNTCVNLIQTCSNCSYSNISSVIAPNSASLLGQVVMTKISNVYNYSFCSTSQIGSYIVNGISDVDGSQVVWAYDFQITPSGSNNNPNFYYIIFIASLGVMILGFVLKNAPIVILGSFGMVYLGLYIILFGINGIKDTVYTWGWGIIILAVAGYIGIKSAYEMITD